jgi:cyanate lyase
LTFAEIGKAIGRDEVWVAALFYGQAKPRESDLEGLTKVLGVSVDGQLGEHWYPNRGNLSPMPPTDPVIYRLYEVRVFRHLLNDCRTFHSGSDGLRSCDLSLIDCKVTVDKKPDPKGDRVVLTFEWGSHFLLSFVS